jgi:hypothetical protein
MSMTIALLVTMRLFACLRLTSWQDATQGSQCAMCNNIYVGTTSAVTAGQTNPVIVMSY